MNTALLVIDVQTGLVAGQPARVPACVNATNDQRLIVRAADIRCQ